MYLHDDFFLTTSTARELYHEVAAGLPIIDFHTHLPAEEILADRRFANLWELWLEHDHYKWRLLRGCGVEESLITGSASPWEKFEAFASVLPLAVGNPVHHWAHLELRRVFGITTVLSRESARAVWEEAEAFLATDPSLSVRGLLRRFRVELVCTTDDPTADLAVHRELAQPGVTRTLPTFRPDRAMAVDQPERFVRFVGELAEASGQPVESSRQLVEALRQRFEAFHEAGCRLSDHGLPYCPAALAEVGEIDRIFQQVVAQGEAASPQQWEVFAAHLLAQVATWCHEAGWTMQLHLGPLRNVNRPLFQELGPDAGFDTMGFWPQTKGLVEFLGQRQDEGALPRLIVYNLNPQESEALCCALQSFQDATVPGKLQYGPAWWHLDHQRGILEQLEILLSLSALGTSVGMLTDSRSFTSFVRHEFYRRLLCQRLGQGVEEGEIPGEGAALGELVKAVAYGNAASFFQWPAAN
ncbi:MAG: glucuronate isomerase [Verrucomicrobiota bacterium]